MIVVFVLLFFLSLSLFLLFWPEKSSLSPALVSTLGSPVNKSEIKFSVIIPARNEEKNIEKLLKSLSLQSFRAFEVIVVDDSSTDKTAEIARREGATVLSAGPVPAGWRGKTWALQRALENSQGELLIFIDADTFWENGGLDKALELWKIQSKKLKALSLLPFHKMSFFYEDFSFFFNLLMAMGTQSFTPFDLSQKRSRLVGQSLFILRKDFLSAGGFETVKGRVLENFYLSEVFAQKDWATRTFLGKGLLNIQMYPEGWASLCEGWRKAFAKGSRDVEKSVFFTSVIWLSALNATFLGLLFSAIFFKEFFISFFILYFLNVVILFWASRKLGNFPLRVSFFYPLYLLFYYNLYFRSLGSTQGAQWKGREL